MIKYNRSLLVLFSAIIFSLSFPAYSDSNSNRVSELYILPAADSSLKEIADELLEAKKTIEVVVYSMEDSQDIHQVVDALIEAHHNKGVDVRVILQQYVYKDKYFNNAAYKKLHDAGVRVEWAYSEGPFDFTHQKSWVIDHEVAYISTGNFTSNTAGKQRNFYIRTTDKDYINEMGRVFNDDWNYTPKKELKDPKLIWSPYNSKEEITGLINSAKFEIDMYTPELEYSQVVNLLMDKAKQGVKIRIITLKPEEYDSCSSIKNFNALVNNRIEVYSLQNYFTHAKLVIVDRDHSTQRMFLGSQNFSVNSLGRNRELGLMITNPTIISEAYRQFDEDLGYSKSWLSGTPCPKI